jgi:hypothetical protein
MEDGGMRAPGFLTARIRGFRIVNLLGLTVLLVIALGSYALKTLAGAQDQGGAGVEDQIVQEQKRIRMLEAEISTLGGPQRVADLSRQYLNLAPPDARHDITEDALPAMAAELRNPSPEKPSSLGKMAATPLPPPPAAPAPDAGAAAAPAPAKATAQ